MAAMMHYISGRDGFADAKPPARATPAPATTARSSHVAGSEAALASLERPPTVAAAESPSEEATYASAAFRSTPGTAADDVA